MIILVIILLLHHFHLFTLLNKKRKIKRKGNDNEIINTPNKDDPYYSFLIHFNRE